MAAAGERLGNYVLEEHLRSGGMADVFRARNVGAASFSRHVCIKRMLPNLARDPEFVALFLDEANTGSKLRHKNIVSIEYLGEHAGQYFLAMEFVNGANLDELRKRVASTGAQFPADAAAFVAHEVLNALDAAHTARDPDDGVPLGIIHRDVTPHNVMVSYTGEVKLTDFGIARAARQARVTDAGVARGRLGYMPLEQYSGAAIDARADLFALGATLFELLAGFRTFRASDPHATQESIFGALVLDDRVPIASVRPDAPMALCALIDTMLSPKPEGRPPSAAAALESIVALREVTTGEKSLKRLLARLYPGQGSVADLPRTAVPPTLAPAAPEPDPRAGVRTRPMRAKRRGPVSEPSHPAGDRSHPTGEPDTVPSAPARPTPPTRAALPESDATSSVPLGGVSATLPRATPIRASSTHTVAAVAAGTATVALAAGLAFLLPALRHPAPARPLAALPPVTQESSATTATSEPTPAPAPARAAHEEPAPVAATATPPARTAPRATTPVPAHTAPTHTAHEEPAPVPVPTAPAPAPASPAPASPAPAPAPAHEEPATGVLHVVTEGWANVTIDGRGYGRAPVHPRLSAGRHTVHVEGSVEGTRSVEVPANGSASVRFDAAE